MSKQLKTFFWSAWSGFVASLPSQLLFLFLLVITLWLAVNIVRVGSGDGLVAAGPLFGRAKPAASPASAPIAASKSSAPADKASEAVAGSSKPEDKGKTSRSGGVGGDQQRAGGSLVPRLDGAAASAAVAGASGIAKAADAAPSQAKAAPEGLPASFEQMSVLAALCGALGATLHALGSLVAFVGNGKFVRSWSLWYVAQPVRGAVLASGVYWAWYGSLIDSKTVDWPKAGVGVLGLMFMVGLFSDSALEKLREVFLVLFRTGTKPRADPIDGARKPVIATVRLNPGAQVIQLEIGGDRFEPTDEVTVNNSKPQILLQTAKNMVVVLPAALAVTGTRLNVVVRPTAKGAEDSAAATITVP